jgi:hypothetical protein
MASGQHLLLLDCGRDTLVHGLVDVSIVTQYADLGIPTVSCFPDLETKFETAAFAFSILNLSGNVLIEGKRCKFELRCLKVMLEQ